MDPNTDQLNHRLCWKDIQKKLYGDISLVSTVNSEIFANSNKSHICVLKIRD